MKLPTETRYCPFCDDEIPKTTNKGKPIADRHYKRRGSCGKFLCKQAFTQSKPEKDKDVRDIFLRMKLA